MSEVLARASADPAARAKLAAVYRGRHDVLDALAWRVEPGHPGPSGAADPAAGLPILKAKVYGRDAAALPTAQREALESQLALLMHLLDDDRSRLDEALASVDWSTPVAPEPQLRAPVALTLPNQRRLRMVLGGLAAASLVVGSVAAALAPADSLEVFASPASSTDPVPPAWLLQARSVEASAVRWIGEARGWDVFVLQDGSGHLCMTVVDGARGTGSCLTTVAFAAHGLSVELPFDSSAGFSGNPPRNFASWGPTGGLRVQVGVDCQSSVYPC